MSIVTRYPPSPTGDLHIGGARTALFCWAFARHAGGRFVLRMEDTDRARSSRESEASILDALRWLGIDWDPVPGFDGIPRQSERAARYAEVVAQLLASEHAYRCICSPEQVEAMRERARAEGRNPAYDGSCRERRVGPDCGTAFAVRLAVPEDGGATRWVDLVAGASGEDASQVDDFVIARSDGSAVYHLAVVVDDHDMGVTHVVRGREHMSSTPRQLLLYQGLGWEPPEFGHVPLLVGANGKKLSKREQSVSVQSYRDRGFLPEAVRNFIARLGWGHGDLEIFSREELVRHFRLEDVGRSPARVDEDKLAWLNQHYLKELPAERLQREMRPFLEARAGDVVSIDAGLASLLELLRERSTTYPDMAERAQFYLASEIDYDEKAARKFLKPEVAAPLRDLRDALARLERWEEAEIEKAFTDCVGAHGLRMGQLAQPVRVALTGSSASPGIFETAALLGSERCLPRLDAALAHIGNA